MPAISGTKGGYGQKPGVRPLRKRRPVDSPWFNAPDAAKYLGFSLTSLHERRRAKLIIGYPDRLKGRIVWFHREDLDRYVLGLDPIDRVAPSGREEVPPKFQRRVTG